MYVNYLLWGFVKAHVYTDKHASIDELEDNIEGFICEIPAEMLERVCQNWTKRMEQLKQYLHEIIFSTLNYMHRSEYYVFFFFNFPIASKEFFVYKRFVSDNSCSLGLYNGYFQTPTVFFTQTASSHKTDWITTTSCLFCLAFLYAYLISLK